VSAPSLFEQLGGLRPLAARMRPVTLDEFAGQEHLLAPGRPLRDAVERGTPGSIILWGPPGSGKTTLAHLMARATHRAFEPFSAVTEGVPRIREIVAGARERRASSGQATILFIDEIHRLNKAQQDSLLPPTEEGVVTLVGATTENPSFAINPALLSRTRVFVLQPLQPGHLRALLERALADRDRGVASLDVTAVPQALDFIAEEADGDARRALTVLEAAAMHVGQGGVITIEAAQEALQRRFAHYDKAGEEHYNILSAYHKSLRGSDPQGALYWMARLVEGGGDPMILFRRAMAMSAEDIGLADPNALRLAVAARDAWQMLGPPEGYLPLAELTIYLATAPKSNSAKVALDAAMNAARDYPAEAVPLHLRNAPTGLMKEMGYGKEYRYAHAAPEAYIAQQYLPEPLRGQQFYQPGPFGHEQRIAERMKWWEELADGRSSAVGQQGPSGERNG
jgi:putative ATPase